MKFGAGLAVMIAATSAIAQVSLTGDGERLLKAVRDSDGAIVTEILDAPGSTTVNYRGHDGNSGLHIVTRARNSNWMAFFLAKGADPNLGDRNGDTPLIIAARSGFAAGVTALLARKADPNRGNRLGETALIAAVQARQPAIIRALLEAGANPDKQDFAAGFSARDYARRDTRNRELLQLIETVRPKAAKTAGPARP